MKAVIDRIEGNLAVLLVGDKETPLNVPLFLLPEKVKEGTWLHLEFSVDDQLTNDFLERNKRLLERLKMKGRGGR